MSITAPTVAEASPVPRRSGTVATPQTPEHARPRPPNHCVNRNSPAVAATIAVDVRGPHVLDRESVLALERALQREVQRGRQHASDLLAIVLARDPDVGFHGRATIRGYIGQTQGDAPHFGQPAA